MNGSIFEKNVAVFAKKQRLFGGCGRVLLAVSGGADSVALCSAMAKLTGVGRLPEPAGSLLPEPTNDVASRVEPATDAELATNVELVTDAELVPDVELVIGHVNHKLRGIAGDGDEEFVVKLAETLGLTVLTRSVATRDYAAGHKVSIETAARQLRRDALIDMAAEGRCDAIATAHHKDDNAETVVHRLMRGTGIRGLGGIWPKRTLSGGSDRTLSGGGGRILSGGGRRLRGAGGEIRFIRPLLCANRAEIVEYCKGKQLSWRTDHTNDDVSFTRNRIRHLLLPHLQQASEGKLCDQLAELSQVSRRLYGKIALEVDGL
ncbi:MAG: tRNA lysidine(34) synthetase TilS, partial [Planctomycetes bacterium]|nr:tRNA lysidine(34) synthetase TilS [Planctomycetota bacterium]